MAKCIQLRERPHVWGYYPEPLHARGSSLLKALAETEITKMSKYVELEDLRLIRSREDLPLFLEEMQAEYICEVGVREGNNLKRMLVPCIRLAYAIDSWCGTTNISQNPNLYSQEQFDKWYQAVVEIASCDVRVRIIREFSPKAASLTFATEDGLFDFVYIDSDHTEAGCWADLNAWYPKVRAGGVLAGDDYVNASIGEMKFGVIEAVNRFVSERGLQLHIDSCPHANWYIPVP